MPELDLKNLSRRGRGPAVRAFVAVDRSPEERCHLPVVSRLDVGPGFHEEANEGLVTCGLVFFGGWGLLGRLHAKDFKSTQVMQDIRLRKNAYCSVAKFP